MKSCLLLLLLALALAFPVSCFAADNPSLAETRNKAEQGDAKAQYDLGNAYNAYYDDKGVTKNFTEAVKWYRKAAEQNLAEAQVALGSSYREGSATEQKNAEAMSWFRKAADQGDARGQFHIGMAYEFGWANNNQPDILEAIKWYRKAAEQGYDLALIDLSQRYRLGLGVPRNYAESFKWTLKAAEHGGSWAQLELGKYYASGGKGIPKDIIIAYAWVARAAANREFIKAQYELDSLESKMSPAEIQEGQKRAAKLLRKNHSANLP